MQTFKYQWAAKGDLNAFFALMLDNMLNLVFLSSILAGFGYPLEYIYKLMIPGTAFGVLVGDLVYSVMAMRLAKKTGRSDVTAMPLGLDAPSTIGVALMVLGPAWVETKDPILTWQIGMATLVLIGIVKVICSFIGDKIRRTVPEAGLIGSLAGVGLALLAFLPLIHIFSTPVVGLIALGLVFYTLIARGRLPFGIPGAFAAVAVGSILWHIMGTHGYLTVPYHPLSLKLNFGFPMPHLGFIQGFSKALHYLPIAIPFGVLTIVGGINVTESARLAGDEYKTRSILLTEAIATLVAGVCGGVSQSTPYIGHPAYKKMGARAAYTLATGLFIGLGGCLGYVSFIVDLIPVAAVGPILVFVGLDMIDQGFSAPPKRHLPAVGMALLPCVAELIRIIVTGSLHVDVAQIMMLPEHFRYEALNVFNVISMLGHGFIITAMLWGAACAQLIDKKIKTAAVYFAICAFLTSFGLIHSASADGGMYLPWRAPSNAAYHFTIAYAVITLMFFFISFSDARFEKRNAIAS